MTTQENVHFHGRGGSFCWERTKTMQLVAHITSTSSVRLWLIQMLINMCTSTGVCCACKQGRWNVKKREPIPCNKWQSDLFLEFKIFGRFGTKVSRPVRKLERNICSHSSEVAAQVTSSSSNGGYQPVCAQLGSGKQSAPLIAYLTGVTQGNETTLWNVPIAVQSQLPASPAHVRVCVLLHAGIPLLPFHFPFAVNSNR